MNRKLLVDEMCKYKRFGPEGDAVHLQTTVSLVKPRSAENPRGRPSRRLAGQMLCESRKGKDKRAPLDATREEFVLEPCHRCLHQAELYGLVIGPLWSDVPGPFVPLYTTSPAERDRPYLRRDERPVGYCGTQRVFRVQVPLMAMELTERWLKRDAYYCWDEHRWQAMLETGRAEKY